MNTKTEDSNVTIFFEDEGGQVYPCRCGEIHRGDYAIYDYGHHNCFHKTDLIGLPAGKDKIQAICPECGMSWYVMISEN